MGAIGRGGPYIEEQEINKLNPAPYNPRQDLKPGDKQYELIKKSIEEFGLVDPLIVNSVDLWTEAGDKFTVVGGHQRLKVLKNMGRDFALCSVIEIKTKSKEQALNLALNKIGGGWEYKKLRTVLINIDTGEFDVGITGFDDKEIEGLMTKYGDEYGTPELEFSKELMLEHNYILLYFDNPLDWQVAKEKFGLKQTKPLLVVKNQTTGIGRVVEGKKWLKRIK